MMIFESVLGLVVNVCCKLEGNHLKIFKRSIIDVLRKERKWNHSKCSIKTTKGIKGMEDKNRTKEHGQFEN